MKIGALKEILARFSDDMDVEIAPTPDICTWTNDILPFVHADETKIVLALSETTTTDEEQELVFRNEDGEVVRPV